MPVTYTIDAARKRIYTRCTDRLVFADVLGHFRELLGDPACVGVLDALVDVTQTTYMPEASQLDAVVSEVRAIRKKVQFRMCAVVAASDSMFGMMRMFEVFATPYFRAIRVFRDAAAARAWLDAGSPQEESQY